MTMQTWTRKCSRTHWITHNNPREWFRRQRGLAPVQSPNSLQSATDKFLVRDETKKRLRQKEPTFLFFCRSIHSFSLEIESLLTEIKQNTVKRFERDQKIHTSCLCCLPRLSFLFKLSLKRKGWSDSYGWVIYSIAVRWSWSKALMKWWRGLSGRLHIYTSRHF